jgi:UrcA family protein
MTMNRTTNFRRAYHAALLVTAGLAVIPAIGSAAEPLSRTVRVSDLNLASHEGQQTFEQRVRAAIDEVCAPLDVTSASFIRNRRLEECRQTARASVQRQIERRSELVARTTSR